MDGWQVGKLFQLECGCDVLRSTGKAIKAGLVDDLNLKICRMKWAGIFKKQLKDLVNHFVEVKMRLDWKRRVHSIKDYDMQFGILGI